MTKLSIILPAFNEELNIERTSNILITKLNELVSLNLISKDSYILFVDDGSVDQTWNQIIKQNQTNAMVRGLKLSRNFGHQAAMLAGLDHSRSNVDVTITMDSDLQHDPNTIIDFINLYLAGNEIVYGIRSNRSDESLIKKIMSSIFYKIMIFFDAKIIKNHADFRLISSKVLNYLFKHSETNLFLRGIIPTLGFKSTTLRYNQLNREFGKTQYSFTKMLNLALNGITSFSIKPLRIIFHIGLLSSILSLIGIVFTIINYLNHKTVTGWSSIIIAIYFIGGVQLTCIGILGEYVGKIYSETKRRPLYIVEGNTDSI